MSDEAEHTEHSETSHLATGMMVFSMILWMSFGHKISHSSRYIGEGMAASLTGLAIGIILLTLRETGILHKNMAQQLLTFNHTNFFVFFLPPIILYAGLSVRKKAFFKNLPTIASNGILGTYVAFALIAVLLYSIRKAIGIKLSDCLALGAIFATTDSVAVLQVLEEDRAPLLFSLVFGEGVINDATSVALLRTVQGLGTEPSMTFGVVMKIFGKFAYLLIVSLLMGLIFGLLSALLLKKYNVSSAPQAVGMIGMIAYFSYLAGDYLGFSGIVSLFCCAVVISHYTMPNINKQQRAAVLSTFETLSFLSEGSIFVYVGLDALDPQKWGSTYARECIALVFYSLFLLLFSRAIFIAPILLAHNRWSDQKLTYSEMVIAWWAGGMRGAVSVALVYAYYDPDGTTTDRARSTLISMTLTVVLISTLVFGAVTKPLLDFMLGSKGEHHELATSADVEMGPLHGGDKAPHVSLDDLIHRKMDLTANPTAQLFAPSEAGYTTDATEFDGSESTSSGGEADSEIDLNSPKQGDSEETVERSAESIGPREEIQSAESPGVTARRQRRARSATIAVPPLPIPTAVPSQIGALASIVIPLSVLNRTKSDAPEDTQHSRNRVKFIETADGKPLTPRSRMSDSGSVRPRSQSFTGGAFSSNPAAPGEAEKSVLAKRQLTDWWDSFDSRYMRPYFSKPQEDSPRADVGPSSIREPIEAARMPVPLISSAVAMKRAESPHRTARPDKPALKRTSANALPAPLTSPKPTHATAPAAASQPLVRQLSDDHRARTPVSPSRNIFSDLMPESSAAPIIESAATFGSSLPAAMIPSTMRQALEAESPKLALARPHLAIEPQFSVPSLGSLQTGGGLDTSELASGSSPKPQPLSRIISKDRVSVRWAADVSDRGTPPRSPLSPGLGSMESIPLDDDTGFGPSSTGTRWETFTSPTQASPDLPYEQDAQGQNDSPKRRGVGPWKSRF